MTAYRLRLLSLLLSPLLLLSGILDGCSGHDVCMVPPPLHEYAPLIETGFYIAYRHAGNASEPPNEAGALFLQMDEFFEHGVRFMGIRGVFYPKGLIWTEWHKGGPRVVGMADPDGGEWRELAFTRQGEGWWNVRLSGRSGVSDSLLLKYVGRDWRRPEKGTLYIAHRGTAYQPPQYVGGIYPANTIPAFEAALRSGYDGFELDVRVTKDLRWIVSHDEDLEVTTMSSGLVNQLTCEQAKRCTVVASTTVPEARRTAVDAPIAAPLPSLEDVLSRFLPDQRLRMMLIDVKPDSTDRILTAARADLSAMSDERQRKITFLVRTEETAAALRSLMPHSVIALEGSMGLEPFSKPEMFIPELNNGHRGAHNAVSVGAGWLVKKGRRGEKSIEILKEFQSLCREYDYRLICWTVSDEARWNLIREQRFAPDVWLTDLPMYLLAGQALYLYEDSRAH